jgi:outer membrane protein OmpA-like peptidoglycan-associated protein
MKNIILPLLILTTVTIGCKTTQSQKKTNLNKTEKAAIIGSSSGAVLGGILGNKKNNSVLGAILGATVGGAVGVVIGNKMDKQAKKIQDELGNVAKVERVSEGIKLTFDSQLLFDFGKASLRESYKDDLWKLGNTLKQYPETDLLIVGHTDNVGSESFNEALSKKRAKTVSNELTSTGISKNRIKVKGKGETQPSETNETDLGRSQNRRVEIAIYANKKMKAAAIKENL